MKLTSFTLVHKIETKSTELRLQPSVKHVLTARRRIYLLRSIGCLTLSHSIHSLNMPQLNSHFLQFKVDISLYIMGSYKYVFVRKYNHADK